MSEKTKVEAFRAKIVQLGGETLAKEYDEVLKSGGIFPPGKPKQPPVDPAAKSADEPLYEGPGNPETAGEPSNKDGE